MNFKCQQSALEELSRLSKTGKHSILIEGVAGCGKTYLAKQFASMLPEADFATVEPTVNAVREATETCVNIDNNIVLCIENLDTGVVASSYALLKSLEEPRNNVYFVVTCRSSKGIPDTILSRSVNIVAYAPIDSDIDTYAQSKDRTKFMMLRQYPIWKSIRSFKDVDTVYSLSQEQIDYISKIPTMLKGKEPISNIQWNIGHFPDNSEVPIVIALRYVMNYYTTDSRIRKECVACLNELNKGRIAAHAVLAKFIMECKYGGG